jgi:hypothetical protein
MANELTYQLQARLGNGNLIDSYASGSLSADQSTASLIRNTQNIGTSAEALALGGVTTPGFAVFQNLDDTNYVEIGVDSGGFVAVVKLKPGEQAILRLATTAPQARANTAAVDLFYIIYSD